MDIVKLTSDEIEYKDNTDKLGVSSEGYYSSISATFLRHHLPQFSIFRLRGILQTSFTPKKFEVSHLPLTMKNELLRSCQINSIMLLRV